MTLYKSFLGVAASLSRILEVWMDPDISSMAIHPLGSCSFLYLLIENVLK